MKTLEFVSAIISAVVSLTTFALFLYGNVRRGETVSQSYKRLVSKKILP